LFSHSDSKGRERERERGEVSPGHASLHKNDISQLDGNLCEIQKEKEDEKTVSITILSQFNMEVNKNNGKKTNNVCQVHLYNYNIIRVIRLSKYTVPFSRQL
jgi:hypothetical protein